jgi:hypothetical protein
MTNFKFIFVVLVLILIGMFWRYRSRKPDPNAYRVTSVEILGGAESHVSDADTYVITAQGFRSTVRAEGYDYIRTGEVLCEAMPGLLFGKYDEAKPCFVYDPEAQKKAKTMPCSLPLSDSNSNINFGQPTGCPSTGSKMFHILSEKAKE